MLSIGAGFVSSKIPLIVLRALSGIAASMTIPSALTLLVNVFTEPTEQARAIGVFGGCGAVGNGESPVQLLSLRCRMLIVGASCSPRPNHRGNIRPVCIVVLGVLVRCPCVHAHRHPLHIPHPEARVASGRCCGSERRSVEEP